MVDIITIKVQNYHSPSHQTPDLWQKKKHIVNMKRLLLATIIILLVLPMQA